MNEVVYANQVNKPCPSDISTPVTVPSIVLPEGSKRNVNTKSFLATDVFVVGDVVHTDAGVTNIVEKDGGLYTVNPELSSPLSPGSIVYTVVNDTTAGRDIGMVPNPSTTQDASSASGLAVIFALVAMLLALF